MRPQDKLEEATKEFLATLGSDDIVYEPNGPSTCPDFCFQGQIAVEVTGLVKSVSRNGKTINITQTHPGLIASLENVIHGITFSDFTTSAFVGLDIQLPIDLQDARPALKKYLLEAFEQGVTAAPEVQICDGLSIDISPASKIHATPFILGSISGPDLSGWVVSELLSQCENAMQRKHDKMILQQEDYSEFWLAVGSHLTQSISRESLNEFTTHFESQTFWNKLLLIDIFTPAESIVLTLK